MITIKIIHNNIQTSFISIAEGVTREITNENKKKR